MQLDALTILVSGIGEHIKEGGKKATGRQKLFVVPRRVTRAMRLFGDQRLCDMTGNSPRFRRQ